MITRRRALAAALAPLAATACARLGGPVRGDVVAAGQPAALLIWALARDRLAGWPRRPSPDALAEMPQLAATLPEIGALAGGGRPASVEAIAALKPARIIDYGDRDRQNTALAERMRARLSVSWTLIDGALTHTPRAIVEAGDLLGAAETARALSATAEAVLARWEVLEGGPAFYYARGSDGLETGFKGALATEVLEGAGWTNVAERSRDIGRVTREQVAAWDPEVLVTLDPGFARAAADAPEWRRRRGGARRRLLLLPDKPFGWVDRPPSLNRLLGCAWLARPNGRPEPLIELSRRLYGAPMPTPTLPRWIP